MQDSSAALGRARKRGQGSRKGLDDGFGHAVNAARLRFSERCRARNDALVSWAQSLGVSDSVIREFQGARHG